MFKVSFAFPWNVNAEEAFQIISKERGLTIESQPEVCIQATMDVHHLSQLGHIIPLIKEVYERVAKSVPLRWVSIFCEGEVTPEYWYEGMMDPALGICIAGLRLYKHKGISGLICDVLDLNRLDFILSEFVKGAKRFMLQCQISQQLEAARVQFVTHRNIDAGEQILNSLVEKQKTAMKLAIE